MRVSYRCGNRRVTLEIERLEGNTFEVSLDGRPARIEATLLGGSVLHLTIDGRSKVVCLARQGTTHHVFIDGVAYAISPDAASTEAAETHVFATPTIVAPMPGKVLKVLVREGQQVEAGDTLLILEAMKMETRIESEAPAVVERLLVSEGQTVDAGTVLIELAPRP